MCIIVIKPDGIKVPDKSVFDMCFKNNPDGIGYMYRTPEDVTIRKGFFDVDEFYSEIKDMTDQELIIHFRYATHGTTSPGNCHPFPLSRRVKDLTCEWIGCEIGIAHNGIVSGMKKDKELSDTMMFLKTLSGTGIKELPGAMGTTNGKFVIMTRYKTYMVGDYLYDSANGCYFSNDTYKHETVYVLYDKLSGSDNEFYCKYCLYNKPDKTGFNAEICDMCFKNDQFIDVLDMDEDEETGDYRDYSTEFSGTGGKPCTPAPYECLTVPKWLS